MGSDKLKETGSRWRLRDYHCVLILLLLTLVFFRNALFTAEPVILGSPVLVDLTHQFYPWRLFGFGLLTKGTIPLWNPYLFCGQPFIAAMQSAIFYPPNLIFLVLPVHTAINWSFALHVFLSGAFVYAYMRYVLDAKVPSLLSAVSFMWCAPLVLRVFSGHLSIVCSLPWFPLELLAVEAGVRMRRHRFFLLAGGAFAAQLLAGQPQYVFYSALAILIYCACRCIPLARERGTGKTFIFAVSALTLTASVAAGLSAVQLVPGLEFVPHSARHAMSFEEVAGGSLPPENCATFIVPELFGDFLGSPYWGRSFLWEVSVYIGILPLCLALLALLYGRSRYVALFALLAAASLLLALGGRTPLLSLLYRYVPPFRLFRGSGKALFVAAYSLCFMAGFGCGLLTEPGAFKKRIASRCALVIIIAAAACALCAVVALVPEIRNRLWTALLCHRPPRLRDPSHAASLLPLAMRGVRRLLVFLPLSIALMLWSRRRRGTGALLGLVMAAVVVADLWSVGARYVITSPVASCWWPRDIADFLKSDSTLNRYLRDIRVTVPGVNQGMNDHLYGYQGYDPHNLKRYSNFVNRLNVRSEDVPQLLLRPELLTIVSLANLKYLIVPASVRLWFPDYRLRFDNGYIKVLENTRVLPRARVVYGATVIREPDRVLGALKEEGFDPAARTVIEEEPGIDIEGQEGSSPAEVERYGPREIIVSCTLERPGLLVLSDVYYPGWKVTVDGTPERILRANYLFRAVPLGRGAHRVRFSYRPASFRYGAAVSILSLVVTAAFLLRGGRTSAADAQKEGGKKEQESNEADERAYPE